jgi:hypothetical protein
MTRNRTFHPLIVGLLLGVLQTGLYFQLSFTLSSGFGTYLMLTLAWLFGSLIGVRWLAKQSISMGILLLVILGAYGLCCVLLLALPFNFTLFPLYAILIVIIGLYPGVFFARTSQHYPASVLFYRENNGFIVGLMLGTVLFMSFGRIVLWVSPLILVGYLWLAQLPEAKVNISP